MSHDDKKDHPTTPSSESGGDVSSGEERLPDRDPESETNAEAPRDAAAPTDAARTEESPENDQEPEGSAGTEDPPDCGNAGGTADSPNDEAVDSEETPETKDVADSTGTGDSAATEQSRDVAEASDHEDTVDASSAATASDATAQEGGAGEAPADADAEGKAGAQEEAAEAVSDQSGGTAPPQPPQAGGAGQPPVADDPGLEEDDEDDDEEEDEEEEQGHMTFLDHLSELRIRLTRIAIAMGVGFLACYGFSKQLFEFLMRPLVEVFPPDSKLIFTALPEAFFTYIKVALVGGVLLTSPYIFYQIWSFVAPGLYDEERKHLVPVALFSGLFFVAGATFGYSVVFPFAFEFFMDFATETIRPMPSLREYLSFSLKLLFAFGFIFELPLFIFFLSRLGIVNSTMLRKFRKYAFLCSFLVAAVLTPPDVISQTLMAGPLIVLYEASIWIAHFFGKKPKEPEPDEEEEDPEDEEEEATETT